MIPLSGVLPPVLLIPTSVLESEAFQILATFVALNSLIYATLAVLKVLPKGYALFRFDGRNRRRQNRSIYPDPTPQPIDDAGPSPADAASTPTQARPPLPASPHPS
jgi:hypothetical protein